MTARIYILKDSLLSIGGIQWLTDRVPEIGAGYVDIFGTTYNQLQVNSSLTRDDTGTGTAYCYNLTTLPSHFNVEFKVKRSSSGLHGSFTLARNGENFDDPDIFLVLDWDGTGSATLSGGAGGGSSVDVSGYVPSDDVQYTFLCLIESVGGTTVFTYSINGVQVLQSSLAGVGWFTGFLGMGLYDQSGETTLALNDLFVFQPVPPDVYSTIIPPATMTIAQPSAIMPYPSIKPSYVPIPVTITVWTMLDMATRAWGSEYNAPDKNIYVFSNGRGFDSTDLSRNGVYGVIGDDGDFDTLLIDNNYPDMQTELLTDNVSVSSPPNVGNPAQYNPETWQDVYELFTGGSNVPPVPPSP